MVFLALGFIIKQRRKERILERVSHFKFKEMNYKKVENH